MNSKALSVDLIIEFIESLPSTMTWKLGNGVSGNLEGIDEENEV